MATPVGRAEKDWKDAVTPLGSFLQLPPAVQVQIIIDQNQLCNCVESLRNEPIVGLDVEWCPQTKELSLLQIATSTRHVVSWHLLSSYDEAKSFLESDCTGKTGIDTTPGRVYLVDFVECGTGVNAGQAVRALLEDTDVIKLAYSLLGDLVQLNRVFRSIVSANAVCDLRYALTTQRKGTSPANSHRCDRDALRSVRGPRCDNNAAQWE
jgi:hypothetical protein